MNYELIYIGKGKGTLQGIPARSLTATEIQASGMTAEQLIATGLYQRPVVELQPDDVEKLIKRVRKVRPIEEESD